MGFLKKVWKKIRRILAIILIIIAVVILCYVAWMYFVVGTAWSAISITIAGTEIFATALVGIAAASLVVAFLVDKSAASKAVQDVAEAVGNTVGAVAGFAVGSVALAGGKAISSAAKIARWWLLLPIGIGAYLLLRKD